MQQVPFVAVEVAEDRDGAVVLVTRRLEKLYPARDEGPVVAREIVRVEKQKHAPAGLVAHRGEFGGVFRLGQEQAAALRPRPRWRDDHPALARSARRVLDEPKPEGAGVVGNGFVVVADDERNGGE